MATVGKQTKKSESKASAPADDTLEQLTIRVTFRGTGPRAGSFKEWAEANFDFASLAAMTPKDRKEKFAKFWEGYLEPIILQGVASFCADARGTGRGDG